MVFDFELQDEKKTCSMSQNRCILQGFAAHKDSSEFKGCGEGGAAKAAQKSEIKKSNFFDRTLKTVSQYEAQLIAAKQAERRW